ncbi:MAG: 16S rRNA (adenine(1518)-N(6)/adenine(1519)-N(6))-dimethyltransferase RsmA [bacterium]
MNEVKAKKFLGQHFLTDEGIAQRIVDNLSCRTPNVIEIGPGMGVLTKYLIGKQGLNFHVVEIDRESVAWLHEHFPTLDVIEGDFLKLNLSDLFHDTFAVIGNFPYNISSQILFRVFECRNQAVEVVGMFQKEVAERIAAGPGSKTYGILSVLLSAFYNIEYLFTVHEHVFNPPPKVKSAVIRLTRNEVTAMECDEKLFVQVVKAGFNQRRKTLRNALRSAGLPLDAVKEELLGKRAEQLSVNEFILLTKSIQSCL